MLVQNILAVGVLASGAVAGTLGNGRHKPVRCNAPGITPERKALAKEFAQQEAEARISGKPAKAAVDVKVYIHNVASSSSGFLSDATIKKQMDVIAADFAPSGFRLTLAKATKTVNAKWAEDGDEMAMKKALRQGDYRDLNFYFLNNLQQGALGYCYFPTTATRGSTAWYRDGCSIQSSTAPGGAAPYGEGKTATHEAGHWFGLEHTFEGGCNGGDGVDDTPAQSSSTSGCPTGRDSCPSKPGLDPIHNYMDYSDDACYEEFTAGQNTRMASYWTRFRQGK